MLIPARPGYEARFEKEQKDGLTDSYELPVLAWDHEGVPWVMPENGKRLVPVTEVPEASYGSFDRVDAVDAPVVAAVPGAGWKLQWKWDNGTESVEPVIAWLVQADGFVRPTTKEDPAGTFLWVVSDHDIGQQGRVRAIPPGETSDPPSEPVAT
jgi:hypothetical protein